MTRDAYFLGYLWLRGVITLVGWGIWQGFPGVRITSNELMSEVGCTVCFFPTVRPSVFVNLKEALTFSR